LERHGCEGLCPVYTIIIAGNGTVLYEGRANVKAIGTRQSHVPKAAVIQLLERFRKADFVSALPAYSGAYDAGDNVLQVGIDRPLIQLWKIAA